MESGTQTTNLVDGQNNYSVNVSACGTALAEFFTLQYSTGGVTSNQVSAYQSIAETVIVTSDVEGVIIGFKGFDVGDYTGNILFSLEDTGVTNGITDQATINITRYDDVGGVIVGSYSEGAITGSFVASRKR